MNSLRGCTRCEIHSPRLLPKREGAWYSWRTKGEYEVSRDLQSIPCPSQNLPTRTAASQPSRPFPTAPLRAMARSGPFRSRFVRSVFARSESARSRAIYRYVGQNSRHVRSFRLPHAAKAREFSWPHRTVARLRSFGRRREVHRSIFFPGPPHGRDRFDVYESPSRHLGRAR
jgi:hypothetical protein